MSTVTLRELTEDDRRAIRGWPTHPPDCLELDYALREGGWIDHHANHGRDRLYAAVEGGELVGFSALYLDGDDEAEFLVALRGDSLGRGLGRRVTRATLDKCVRVSIGRACQGHPLCSVPTIAQWSLERHVSIGADVAHSVVGLGGLSGQARALTSARQGTGECPQIRQRQLCEPEVLCSQPPA